MVAMWNIEVSSIRTTAVVDVGVDGLMPLHRAQQVPLHPHRTAMPTPAAKYTDRRRAARVLRFLCLPFPRHFLLLLDDVGLMRSRHFLSTISPSSLLVIISDRTSLTFDQPLTPFPALVPLYFTHPSSTSFPHIPAIRIPYSVVFALRPSR
jgi:hypothetical protein